MAAAPIHNMAMFILSVTVRHGDEQCHLTIDSLATSWQPLRIPSPDEQIPHWFSSLSQRDFLQIWLSGLRSSMVAYLCQCHRDQFSVDWLCEFGVPVWYPWGCQETRASQTNARLARFAPLPHQLQESSTFLTTNPTPQPQPNQPQNLRLRHSIVSYLFLISLIYIHSHLGAATSALFLSWKAFFEKRRARNELLKTQETPKQRQAGESREKNPPVKRTKVFLWRREENNEYRRESFYQAKKGMTGPYG